jgi:hypothetical protein
LIVKVVRARCGRADLSDKLDSLAQLAATLRGEKDKLPPVASWNPPDLGSIDIRIARDGRWYHEGDLLQREALVKLFATVLRREGDDYYLVTPVEKWRITVDDAPFVTGLMERLGEGAEQLLCFITNTGERVVADADHLIRVEHDAKGGEPSPYLMVCDGLEALISRSLFFDLANLGERAEVDGDQVIGIWSAGLFFPLGSAGE